MCAHCTQIPRHNEMSTWIRTKNTQRRTKKSTNTTLNLNVLIHFELVSRHFRLKNESKWDGDELHRRLLFIPNISFIEFLFGLSNLIRISVFDWQSSYQWGSICDRTPKRVLNNWSDSTELNVTLLILFNQIPITWDLQHYETSTMVYCDGENTMGI